MDPREENPYEPPTSVDPVERPRAALSSSPAATAAAGATGMFAAALTLLGLLLTASFGLDAWRAAYPEAEPPRWVLVLGVTGCAAVAFLVGSAIGHRLQRGRITATRASHHR